MKKVSVIVIFVLLFFSVAIVAINYLYPYYVHLSSMKYANEVKESKIDKDNFILCSKITEDKTVNSMYISFYVLDKASQSRKAKTNPIRERGEVSSNFKVKTTQNLKPILTQQNKKNNKN